MQINQDLVAEAVKQRVKQSRHFAVLYNGRSNSWMLTRYPECLENNNINKISWSIAWHTGVNHAN